MGDRLRARNRISLKVWLENYSDFYGKRSPRILNFEELGKPGPTTPLGKRNYAYLDADAAWESHRTLQAALERLRAEYWYHYQLLLDVYLDDGANPTVLDRWAARSHEDRHAKMKLDLVEQAIEHLLDYVGRRRLTVPLPPLSGRGVKERDRRKRRYDALISYYDRLEAGATPTEAVAEVAAEYSTSRSTVWSWIKQLQG